MELISGLCFSYRSATGGAGGVQPLQFGRLVEAGANGDWSASPLLPIAAVDASLLPVDPDDEEHAVVDGSIQQIPLLVADLRLASRVSVVPGEAICFSPVVVANEMAFRELRALFRDGMEGVFRVTHELPEGMPAGELARRVICICICVVCMYVCICACICICIICRYIDMGQDPGESWC
jgi:hypothetical protein